MMTRSRLPSVCAVHQQLTRHSLPALGIYLVDFRFCLSNADKQGSATLECSATDSVSHLLAWFIVVARSTQTSFHHHEFVDRRRFGLVQYCWTYDKIGYIHQPPEERG